MSWAESEKLNEWILRAYENGRREEQDRIVEIIESRSNATGRDELITLIRGELTECECDPCGNENCTCQGKRCDFCKSQAD